MKTATVVGYGQSLTVKVKGQEAEPLTAAQAQAAVEVAFGLGARAAVWDNEDGYRVSGNRVRKIKQER